MKSPDSCALVLPTQEFAHLSRQPQRLRKAEPKQELKGVGRLGEVSKVPGHSHLLPLPQVSFAQAALSPLPWHSLQPPAQKRHPHARRLHGAASRARLGWAHPHTGVLEKHLQPLPPWQEGQASAELCPPLSPEGADREVTGGAWPGASPQSTPGARPTGLSPRGAELLSVQEYWGHGPGHQRHWGQNCPVTTSSMKSLCGS